MFCLSVALDEDDAELDGSDNVHHIYVKPNRQLKRPEVEWFEGHQRPWWVRRMRWGGKKNKARNNGSSKRIKHKQNKRKQIREEIRYIDDDSRLEPFAPISQWDEDKVVEDPQPIRIRIRLRRRGPVKRHAKKSSKKLRKQMSMEYAEDRQMDSMAKDFLLEDKDDDSLEKVLREAVQTFRRADQLTINGHHRQGLRVKVRRTKRRS